MSILDDLANPKLFAPHFRGDTWASWKAFLAALFALEMDESQLELYRHHTGRTEPPQVPFSEAALVVGRRGGKSRILALIAVYLAIAKDYTPHLAPGEVATIAVIASDRKQARSIYRYALGMLENVPALAGMIDDAKADIISLNNSVVIEIATASFRVTRGYTFAAVLADETAFWRSDETNANPDTEIFRALRPGMASIPGAILLNASSPYRRAGVLFNTFKRHYGRDDARVLVWKATTAEMNPSIDPEIIAEAYEEDPQSAASEYGAEFRDDIADFVSQEVIDACTEIGCRERPPNRSLGYRYNAFIDAAGGSGSDSMTMAITHLEGEIVVLDVVREIKPKFSPDDAVSEFAGVLKAYHVSKAEADRWGGDWVVEAFRKQGITIAPAAKPKADIYRELLPLLNARRCTLLDLPRLSAQLVGLERRVARGGRDSIDHAPGGHDDVANAVAGALLLSNVKRGLVISPETLLMAGMTEAQGLAYMRKHHPEQAAKTEAMLNRIGVDPDIARRRQMYGY
jgi:hypothetical protein